MEDIKKNRTHSDDNYEKFSLKDPNNIEDNDINIKNNFIREKDTYNLNKPYIEKKNNNNLQNKTINDELLEKVNQLNLNFKKIRKKIHTPKRTIITTLIIPTIQIFFLII